MNAGCGMRNAALPSEALAYGGGRMQDTGYGMRDLHSWPGINIHDSIHFDF